MATIAATPDNIISTSTQPGPTLCSVLTENLDRNALAFLSSQGIFSAEELLNRSTTSSSNGSTDTTSQVPNNSEYMIGMKRKKLRSDRSLQLISGNNNSNYDNRSNSVLGADSPLTKALYEWRFENGNDPKPSPKLSTRQDKIRSCVQQLHRWVRKIKIVTGVPCSKGTKMMAESSALGLNESDENHDLQLLGERPRQFLYSQGIYSGEDLLRIRTGDLGINYKIWREKNGLKELKSPGGASSISGWKNIIRTARGIKKGSISTRPLPRRVPLCRPSMTAKAIIAMQEMPHQVTPPIMPLSEQAGEFFDQPIEQGQDSLQCMYDEDDRVVQSVDNVELDDLIYLNESASVQGDEVILERDLSSETKQLHSKHIIPGLGNPSALDICITEI